MKTYWQAHFLVNKAQKVLIFSKRRLSALFFIAIMVTASLMPVGQVYAEVQQRDGTEKATHDLLPPAAKDKIKPKDPNADKPMKQDYAGALATVESKNKAAADVAKPSTMNLPGKLGDSRLTPDASMAGLQASDGGITKSFKKKEVVSKRTADSMTTRNQDGSLSVKQYGVSKFYKKATIEATAKANEWLPIDTKLVEDTNAGDAGTVFGEALGAAQSLVKSPDSYTVKENDWQARFVPSGAKQAMVRIKKGNDQVGFSPIGAKDGVAPVITTDGQGRQTVHYYDLWPGVNVDYEVTANELKENIVVKNRQATSDFKFEIVGAKLSKPAKKDQFSPAYVVDGALNNEFAIAPLAVMLNKYGYEDAGTALKNSFSGNTLSVGLDKAYLDKLPDDAFPVIIDPTYTNRWGFGTRAGGNYVSFKSDGYVCPDTICNPMGGAVLDSGGTWRNWRGMMFIDYNGVKGRQLNNAKFHFQQRLGLPVSGTTDPKWLTMWHGTCFAYDNCRGMQGGSSLVGASVAP